MEIGSANFDLMSMAGRGEQMFLLIGHIADFQDGIGRFELLL